MKSIILFEDEGFVDFLPLTFWRSVFELQVGRKILLDRIAQRLGMTIAGVWTRDWIAAVAAQRCGAPVNAPLQGKEILVNGRWLMEGEVRFPKPPCVGVLGNGEIAYIVCDKSLAGKIAPRDLQQATSRDLSLRNVPRQATSGRLLKYPWEVIRDLDELLVSDWNAAEASTESDLDRRVFSGPIERLHVGERVSIHPTAVVDASSGPIYLGDDVSVGAQAVLEGPLYLGAGSCVHPHAWLHGGNAIGPVCRIGGEMHGCVFHGYTNKQHDGFLGHAYVGSWVNLGAGSANSDLKNTYGTIRVPINGREIETGLQFFGAVVADHVKIGINAAIPTGAVIGLAASVAATRVLPKYLPSFSWVSDESVLSGDALKALDVAVAVMARRNVEMTDEEVELFLDLGQRVQQFESRSASR